MRVLVACEFSGVVRDAFANRGHDAWSCDLLPTESGLTLLEGKHIQGDVIEVLNDNWDLMIAHPPCTHLAVSGAKHFKQKIADGRQQQGVNFFMALVNAPINKIVIENPIGIMSRIYCKPAQIIQPYQFGHNVSKSTCLWEKNVPKLTPTNIVDKGEFITFPSGKRMHKWYADKAFGGEARAKVRSKTFTGIANAMAEQWGQPERR